MSPNKVTVQKYMDGFNKSDHEQILSCLADDIEWLMPGAFYLKGKDVFDKEIENDAFTGNPTIKITRMTEENNQDRGRPRGPAPPTPPGIRITYTAVR